MIYNKLSIILLTQIASQPNDTTDSQIAYYILNHLDEIQNDLIRYTCHDCHNCFSSRGRGWLWICDNCYNANHNFYIVCDSYSNIHIEIDLKRHHFIGVLFIWIMWQEGNTLSLRCINHIQMNAKLFHWASDPFKTNYEF